MKRSVYFAALAKLLAVVMIVATLLAVLPIVNVSAANVTITLDPGHGGKDPGATGASAFGGKTEAQYVLIFCQYMKERLLQYNGATVHLTRTDDTFIELDTRPAIAKNHASDAFISVHCNSYGDPNAHGSEVYTIPSGGNYTASQQMASTVLTHLVNATGNRNRGVKTANYAVLKGANNRNIPVGILIETGFVTNSGDYSRTFATDAHLKKVAYAMADGIASYYNLSPAGSLPGVDVPVVPTTPSYYSCVDHINGVGPNGTPNYNNLNGTPGAPATVDAAASAVPSDNKLSIGGWMGVDGGTASYVYSLDNGATWKNATGGYDGEPLPNHYSGMGFSNATKLGMFHKDISPVVADLSAYAGQKVNVTFAAVSAKDNSFILPFLTVTNYTVAGTAAPIVPTKIASCVDAYSIDGADTADKSVPITITAGQIVGLRGWAGYTVAISKFGYYFDGNPAAAVWTTDPNAETEEPVLGAGGANARRYHIQASTAALSAGNHSINYVMQLSDGTVVGLDSYNFTVKAASQPEVTTPAPEVTTPEPEVTTPEPEETTPEPEHTCSFGAWTETRPATCTVGGISTRTCACGNFETKSIPATGHTEGSWIVDSAAKPGVNGSKHIECTVCHKTLRTEIIPALPVVTEPEVTTTEPEVTTTEPEVTTTEPEVTTTEPEVTTTEPEVTTTEPEVTTTEPEVTTTEPEVTTTEPEVTTAEPEVTTAEPEVTTTEREPEITKPDAIPPENDNGCNSAVSGAMAIVALTTAAGALCLARKKDD